MVLKKENKYYHYALLFELYLFLNNQIYQYSFHFVLAFFQFKIECNFNKLFR